MREPRALEERASAEVEAVPAPDDALSWVEIDRGALAHNYSVFRELAGDTTRLMFVVKANAYGHGLLEVSYLLSDLGADWLATFSVDEALLLRARGLRIPVLVLGPTPSARLRAASREGVSITVASLAALEELLRESPGPLDIHLKLETGTNRQGFTETELVPLAAMLRGPAAALGVRVEGAYTHFANVEDTTDNSFALQQLEAFHARVAELAALEIRPKRLHTACTAAALLYPEAHHDLLRVGVGIYGLWPSETTLLSVRHSKKPAPELRPVLAWKTRIAQIKEVPVGETIGYGRTHEVARPTRVGILPVGYSNGYSRSLTGRAYTLCEGRRANVLGRVMMNMTAIDVTDVPDARVGTEVILLGRSRHQRLGAEKLAGWMNTIAYEVVAGIEPRGRRIVVGSARSATPEVPARTVTLGPSIEASARAEEEARGTTLLS